MIISPTTNGKIERTNIGPVSSRCFSCTLSNQSEKIHYEDTVKAYSEAKAEYLRLHPEAREMVMRYDPIAHLSPPSAVPTS
jgi:hypothetical protein